MWVPKIEHVNANYFELQKVYPSLKEEKILNEGSLFGLIDKLIYGLPIGETNIYDRAAFIIRDIICEHIFTDGNKRLALACFLQFLLKNNLSLKKQVTDDKLADFFIKVAEECATIELEAISSWVENNTFITT